MNTRKNQNMNANLRRSIPWVRVGVCVWMCLLSGPAFGQEEKSANVDADASASYEAEKAKSRERFLVIERIARLPAAEQAQAVPELYNKTAAPLLERGSCWLLSEYRENILAWGGDKNSELLLGHTNLAEIWAAQLKAAEKDLTPDQMADRVGGIVLRDPRSLDAAALSRAIAVLKAHPKITESLIEADLSSADIQNFRRATYAIACLRWQQYNPRLLEMLWSENKDIYGPAGWCLYVVAEDLLKEKLVEKLRADPRSFERFGVLFSWLVRGKKAVPEVLALLESKDDEVRKSAASTLSQCRDAAIGPYAARLASDVDAELRCSAAVMLWRMPDETFKSIRNQVLPLLEDKNLDVRYRAAYGFAQKRDVVAGPVILSALKQPAPTEERRDLVYVGLNEFMSMAGKSNDYDMNKWGPDSERNQKAIAEFERWLSERGVPQAP